jgi:hypothetical protein
MQTIREDKVSKELLSDVVARDCVLWLTEKSFDTKDELDAIVALTDGPWRAVFVESTDGVLAEALSARGQSLHSIDSAGAFTHLIASDPLSLQLQRRAKPLFFLNGRTDRTGTESAQLPRRSSERRRLNMTARLRDLEPRRVIVVGRRPQAALDDLVSLWDAEFRSLLTIVTDAPDFPQSCDSLLEEVAGLNVLHWIALPQLVFSSLLLEQLEQVSASTSLLVSVRLPGGAVLNVDLAAAELAEQPLSDICDFIQLRDTLPVSPEDLRDEEFRSFFTRGKFSWRPYAAGLPWLPDSGPERELLRALHRQLADPPGSVSVLSVLSEPGAGGTTQARALALAAAREGFPAILVKQEGAAPPGIELTGFLFRASQAVSREAARTGKADAGEAVWLVVLDVQHGGRSSDVLERLCAELARSGRKVAVLKVAPASAPPQLPDSIPYKELQVLAHELEEGDVIALGGHLNAYLKVHGKPKSREEWLSFWRQHQPDIDSGAASFWIALEFWLAGFLALGESIQSWVTKQFRLLAGRDELQRAVLEIAALAIERKATPERLLEPLSKPRLPWVTALDSARSEAPGLGLIYGESFPFGRVWAIAHDVLARYLINGVWNDRLLCEQLGLATFEDPVAMRLDLIARLASRTATGDAFARPFAISLATSILKLDEQNGNPEFFKHWRTVLNVLEGVPQIVRLSSRAFNHHLAISRRRVTQDELFQLDLEEKKQLLTAAAREVEFALDQIEPSQDDESTLNLLNSLALIYQDLADLERVTGNTVELLRLLEKSDSITNRALKENPNNSYVLETAAKNQLRQGLSAVDASERIESAARALSFVFQASQLDNAATRRMKLGMLASQALRVLQADSAVEVINRLCTQGSPYGFIARAWSNLPKANVEDAAFTLDAVDSSSAVRAIETLNLSPERNWLLVRLLYDLMVIAHPSDFKAQLRLLDELASTKGYQLSLQQVLERAVLLFIAGQHKQAVEEFKWLRPRVKESQVVIFVPSRLRWLLTLDKAARAVCTARVVDSAAAARGMAQVRELGGASAPFNAQEFGRERMAPGQQFKCFVTFAAMGPFLKPVDVGQR